MFTRTDLLKALPLAVYATDADGLINFYNDAAAELWGRRPELGAERWCGAFRLFGMDGAPIAAEDCPMARTLKTGVAVTDAEAILERPDGTRVPCRPHPTLVRDDSGRVIGTVNVVIDISDRRQHEELQRLLFDELNHRVKNTLATIQAIASQSLRRAASPKEFVNSFSGRVQALGRAHDLLVRGRMKGADIMEIVRDQVTLGGADGARTVCSGPLLEIDAQSAVHVALVLHELATNARRYGALSMPSGKLSISWQVDGDNLDLHWKESGVENLAPPERRGFGSMLIERTLQGSRGSAHVSFEPDGLACRIRMPLLSPDAKPAELRAAESRAAAADPGLHYPTSLRGKRILVVEDEPLIAMDIEQHLSSAGCSIVGPAGSLDEAARLIAGHDFDAALLDANLNGARVDELAALLSLRRIPFAFASGYGRDSLPAGFAEAAYLSKPFSGGQLCAAIAQLLPHA